MDVPRASGERNELDARQQLQADLDSVRADVEGIERAVAGDAEKLSAIRTALDTMTSAVWKDVFAQQQRAKSRDIWTSASRLEWLGSWQFPAIGLIFVIAATAIVAFHAIGGIISGCVYGLFLAIGYFTARDQCVALIKKARTSYLADDGSDLRFVAFTHAEPGLHHPLVGLDGPVRRGTLEDRAWKIPGVRDDDALLETFVEVIDDRHAQILLTRFPDKKPTLVHADLENPFVRAYGVFFQRALERQLPSVATQAEEFRQIVLRIGEKKKLLERVKHIECELHEFDGTLAIVSNLPVSLTVRNKLVRAVVLFRMKQPASRRGVMLFANERLDIREVVETMARASAATFVPFSFSSLKIGYVGQGAAQVVRTFESARRNRSLVFIEDGDCLFNAAGSAGFESMRREVLAAVLQQWDSLDERSEILLVAAARDRDAIDSTMLARFGSLIDLTPPGHVEAIPAEAVPEPETAGEQALPEAAIEKIRVLAAMFAHVKTMEHQGIAVPRGVLVCGPSAVARATAIGSLVTQSGLPLEQCTMDDLDAGVARAGSQSGCLIEVEVREDADPGGVAHLCVLVDELSATGAGIFVLATCENQAYIDPELRSRFGDCIDLPGLDRAARRRKLEQLIAGKPVDFELGEAIDEFETVTDGMGEDRLRTFVEESIGRAALRAIALGKPENVLANLRDFGLHRLDDPLPEAKSA